MNYMPIFSQSLGAVNNRDGRGSVYIGSPLSPFFLDLQ
jgi:hypothetical protein